MTDSVPSPLLLPRRALALALALVFGLASAAAAQTAAAMYERAEQRETQARSVTRPTLAALRTAATSYELVVRRHPRSGYSDNALWQAAELLDWAFQLGGQSRDRTKARQLLTWLSREYPNSRLAGQATSKLASAAQPSSSVKPPAPSASAAAATSSDAPRSAPTPAAPAASTTPSPRPASVPPPLAAPARTPDTALPNQILPAAITLVGVSMTPLPRGERLAFELSQESVYSIGRGSTAGHLVLNLPNVGLSTTALATAEAVKGSLISSVRLIPRNGGTDIELRLLGQPRHSAFPLYGPYRLVVDIETEAPVTRLAPTPPALDVVSTPIAESLAPPPARLPPPAPEPRIPTALTRETPASPVSPSSTTRGDFSLARQLGLGVSRVVIDAGHGGHDPGASAHGVTEADVVLDVALRVEKLLTAQPGFDVVLTRRTDDFVPLEERTARANREGADLFLSIHANSSPQSDTRGVETYFLNLTTNDRAEAVAARENAGSAQSMRLLPNLVRAITLNSKKAESRELATFVQASLVRQLKSQNKTVRDLGIKEAPFVVLIGAEMPSVLAEISFVTNRAEAALLRQPAYRQRIAQALADAVLRYRNSLKRVTSVATTASGR